MSRSWRILRGPAALLAAAGLTVLAACGAGGSSTGTNSAATTSAGSESLSADAPGSADASSGAEVSAEPGAAGTLTVFAAASLKATFTEIGQTFQQQNPGATVKIGRAHV